MKLTLRGAAVSVALLSATLFVACNSDEAADVPTSTESAATIAATATATAAATEAITVTDAWARGTMDVEDPTSAIYVIVHNSGEADRLVSASVPAEIAGKAETHTTEMDGDTMKMVHIDGYDVPANGELVLEQGHNHIMLMMIPSQLKPGDMFTATLHFEHAGDIEVMVEVRELDGGMSGMSMDD